MAIKGKGRTRGRRVVAAPPRPQLVVRKPPIWRRPIAWIVLIVVVAASVVPTVLITVHSRSVRRLKDREAVAVSILGQQIVNQFPQDRQTVPPNLYVFFPSLAADLQDLASGKLKPADADTKAQALLDAASKAADGLSKINVNKVILASFTVSGTLGANGRGITRDELNNASFLMQRAFRLYASIATVMKAAGESEGAKRQSLVDDATQMAAEANELFSQGYRYLARIQTRLGVQAPAA